MIPLGEGGQGAVWKAIASHDGGAVRALKIYQLAGAGPDSSERARREATAISRSKHPGVLRCNRMIMEPGDDLVVLEFDYVHGRSLVDALVDPRMTAAHRRAAVVQLAETLAHVHDEGVVHRDVKPDNVLVTDAFWDAPSEIGTLKLVDFGIAAPTGNPKPLTREGGVVGTAPYLPPELVDQSGLFEPGDDLRRDVFAFGVLAWEVLVGGHPTGLPLGASRDAFAGVYLAARAGKRIWPPEAPVTPELPVVRACLDIAASRRPPSCVAVAEALRGRAPEVTRGQSVTAARTSAGGSPEEARHSLGSQTDIHVPPGLSRAPQATGPGWAAQGPPHANTHRILPVRIPPSATPAQRSRGRGGVVAVLAALLLAGVVAVVVYLWTRSAAPTAGSPGPTTWPTTPEMPLPTPTPRIDVPVVTAPQVACCGDSSQECRSGRPCVPGPCELLKDGPWRLRVIGGFVKEGTRVTEIQREWRSSFICLKNTRTGEEQCASSNKMWTKGSDADSRVLATISDMQKGRILVRVVDGGTERVNAPGFSSPVGYKASALCSNVTLHLFGWETGNGKISVFLDDP